VTTERKVTRKVYAFNSIRVKTASELKSTVFGNEFQTLYDYTLGRKKLQRTHKVAI